MDFNTNFFGDRSGDEPRQDYGFPSTTQPEPSEPVEPSGFAPAPQPADAPDTDMREKDEGADTSANEETGGKRTRKATAKVPKISEDAAKTILDILDLLDDDTAVRAARTVLGTNSTSKATLLALTSEIRGRGLPKLEQSTAKKVVDAVELLDTDTGVAVAKTITGSNSPNRATLLSALTETKTRNHAATIFQHAAKIGAWDADELMMNLALEFASDKDYAKSLFVVLDTAAPDRGFGRSSGDARKDAKTIAEKWGGGVELERFAALRF